MKKHNVPAAVMLIALLPSSAGAAERGFYLGIEAGQSRTEIGIRDSQVIFPRGPIIGTRKDKKDTAAGLYVGYTLSKHFAIELAYSDFGQSVYTVERGVTPVPSFPSLPAPILNPNLRPYPPSFDGPVLAVGLSPERQQTTIEGEAFSLALIGRYPISESFSIIGRAGLSAHLLESDLRVWLNGNEVRVIGGRRDDSAGASVLGVGVEWKVHPKWHLRLEGQRHFVLEDSEFPSDATRGDVTLFTGSIGYHF